MKKTGEFLRKAREVKGLSVHEIGLSLKINPKILKQIEDGDKDNLPAKTFLRGFVQSYALFLKIDPNEVLRIFSDEMGTTKPHQISLTSGPQIKGAALDIEDPENKDDLGIKRHTGKNFSKEKFEFKNVGIGIVVFVLLLSLIAVRKVVEKYQKEAEVDLARTEEDLKASNKLELPQAPKPSTPVPASASEVKPNLTVAATNQPMAVPPTGATTQPTPIPEIKAPLTAINPPTGDAPAKPTNKLPAVTPNAVTTNPTNPVGTNTASPTHSSGVPSTAKPIPAPSLTLPTVTPRKPVAVAPAATPPVKPVTPSAPAEVATTPIASMDETKTVVNAQVPPASPPKEEPKKPKNIELVIEAYENVEIEMTQSNGKTEKIKMTPSQIQTIKTVSGVKLNISNGGAVNLIVNGKEVGVPGDLGKPKKVSF